MVTCFGGAIFGGIFCGGSISTEGWLSGPLAGTGWFSTFGFCFDCSAVTWTREPSEPLEIIICLEWLVTGAVAPAFAGSLPCTKLLTLWDLHRACATYACPQIFVALLANLGLQVLLDNRALGICSRSGVSSGIEKLQGKNETTNQRKFLTNRTQYP